MSNSIRMPRRFGWAIVTWSLRISALFAIIGYFWLRSHIAGIPALVPVAVHLRPEAEIAKLPISKDAYPCFIMEPSGDNNLDSKIQQCSIALTDAETIQQYEVDLTSGRFELRTTDLFLKDDMPLALTRAYGTWDEHSYGFGLGSNHPYDIFPYGSRHPYTYMNLLLPDGEHVYYQRISDGMGYADAVYQHRGMPHTVFEKSRISWNRNHWDLKFSDGTLYQFPESYFAKRGAQGALIGMHNATGEEIRIIRDAEKNLIKIISPHGHWIKFSYDAQNRITNAEDDAGEQTKYFYDAAGALKQVNNRDKLMWFYKYSPAGMTEIQDGSDMKVLLISYEGGRVKTLKRADGIAYNFDYLFDRNRNVIETRVSGFDKPIIFRFGQSTSY